MLLNSKKLKDALQNLLSEDEIQLLVRGYDILGDVAIIIVPEELSPHETAIADAILEASHNIRVVAKRAGKYSDEYRTIALKKIGGQGGLETIHKEYGMRLHVDPEKVYYSPRSGNERYRIASLVSPGERVLVMFSGIAPFPLMIASNSEAQEITGIEKNPVAHLFALKNLAANRKTSNITLLHGDVKDIIPGIETHFSRIVMPLPQSASDHLELAIRSLAINGWLHFYDFCHVEEFETAVVSVKKTCKYLGKEITKYSIHRCGHIAPRKYRICVDAQII